MLELDAAAFYEATRLLQHTTTYIDAKQVSSHETAEDGTVTIVPLEEGPSLQLLRERNQALRNALNVIGAPITLMALDDYDATLASMPTWEAIRRHAQDITTTLRRELTQAKLLALNAQEIGWYEPKQPLFGAKFETKFTTEGYASGEGRLFAMLRA